MATIYRKDHGTTPFALDALLLLTLPLLFTFAKLVVLVTFGERVHQLADAQFITYILLC